MRWIGDYYRFHGHQVSGSDVSNGGHKAENVDGAELVIYTSAITPDNPELNRAKELGIRVISRATALGEIEGAFGTSIAVAGTHGKTTVTAMINSALSGRKVAMHLGGTIKGKNGNTDGEIFLTEACEYKRSFLSLAPTVGVILNVELDHTDYYSSYAHLMNAFELFAKQSQTLVCPCGYHTFNPRADGRKIEVGATGEYALIGYKGKDGESDLLIKTPDGIQEFHLGVIGKHNAENAVFAVATARVMGVDYDEIREGLRAFKGVDRRLQLVGKCEGRPLYSDYAHHPTEIKATLSALWTLGIKNPLIIFQPHTNERLTAFFDDFIKALSTCRTIILPVYNARGKEAGKTSEDLSRALSEIGWSACARSFEDGAQIARTLLPRIDCIITMGAGDNEKILPFLL